jgi:hypothetical protein
VTVPPPQVPNPFDDDAQRMSRLESHVATSSRRRKWVLIGGVVVLAAWGALAVAGLPGTGLALVPIGAFMILGSLLEF